MKQSASSLWRDTFRELGPGRHQNPRGRDGGLRADGWTVDPRGTDESEVEYLLRRLRAGAPDTATRAVGLALYSRMDRGGYCWPSVERVATDAGITHRTASVRLQALEALGWLRARWHGRTGRGHRRQGYQGVVPDETMKAWVARQPTTEDHGSPGARRGSPGDSDVGRPATPNGTRTFPRERAPGGAGSPNGSHQWLSVGELEPSALDGYLTDGGRYHALGVTGAVDWPTACETLTEAQLLELASEAKWWRGPPVVGAEALLSAGAGE